MRPLTYPGSDVKCQKLKRLLTYGSVYPNPAVIISKRYINVLGSERPLWSVLSCFISTETLGGTLGLEPISIIRSFSFWLCFGTAKLLALPSCFIAHKTGDVVKTLRNVRMFSPSL